MNEIPPLKNAIEGAEQDAYDVLILDNWDRLGDLGQLVNTRFKKYRKQIYSARQSSRIQHPDAYDPYSDESADIDMHIQGIIQRYRQNKLRRGWNAGMPKRIENGLTPLRVPFGYVWVNSKQPPRLDPTRASLLQQMKDLLLRGRPVNAIARYADESGVAPPNRGEKWDPTSIRRMLANPYYAGIIGINRTKYIFDPKRKRKKRPVKQPRAKWVVGKGKHEPLWDEATHRALVEELERRRERDQYFAVKFPLSGLLSCSVCRQKLHRHSHGVPPRRWKVFTCDKAPTHIKLRYEDAIDLVARELVKQLSDHDIDENQPASDTDQTQASLDELALQRKRIQAGFKAGIYTEAEAADEIGKIDRQVEGIEWQADERATAAELRAEFTSQFQGNIQTIPTWIHVDDPQIVNRLLSALCEDIIIHPDHQVEIVWRP